MAVSGKTVSWQPGDRMSGRVEASQADTDLKALEDFLVGNQDLERLEALLDRFNILEALGVVRQELRHSDFLRFLLDPRGPHGLGDAFVKRLLQRIMMVAGDVSVPVTPIQLELWDLGRVEVRREWQHIDILLLDEGHKLAVIVENKIGTGEHSDQLQRYYRIVEQHHPGWRVMAVYLTPDGDAPSHESYLPVDYGIVCEVIDDLAEERASVVSQDLMVLMTHYTDMLRRNIVGDSDVARLCRQIYQEHKRALDLIYEHRPDPKVETRELLTELVGNTEGLIYKGRHKNDLLFFRPLEWDEVSAFNAGTARSGFFRFVFHSRPDRLDLFLETSPGDEEVRRRLYEMGQKDESLFNYLEDPETDSYPKLYRRTFLTTRFSEDATDTDREEEIHRHWAEFLGEDLPRIEAALKKERWIWESDEPPDQLMD
jgi:hypothetical protein